MNYLYNGVELPDINEVWDKETYPYAYIIINNALEDEIKGVYQLVITTKEFGFKSSTNLVPKDSSYCYGKNPLCFTDLESLQNFADSNEVTIEELESIGIAYQKWSTKDETEIWQIPSELLVWSSHNILNEDGTVYLAASEPVSADETWQIQKSTLIGVADYFRSKTGKTDKMPFTKEGFASEIDAVYQKGAESAGGSSGGGNTLTSRVFRGYKTTSTINATQSTITTLVTKGE